MIVTPRPLSVQNLILDLLRVINAEYGEYCENKFILKNLNSEIKTDRSFRLQLDEDHHIGDSPLLPLPVDFINNFSQDYMHCECLIVLKKLLNTWISEPLNFSV